MAKAKRIPTSLVVPAAPMPISFYGNVFVDEDVQSLAEAAGLSIVCKESKAEIALRLHNIATAFIGATRALEQATPGVSTRWARETEFRAQALLACFAISADAGDPIEGATRVLRAGASGAQSRFTDLQAALAAVEWIANTAGSAAQNYEQRMGAPRKPAYAELGLFADIEAIFKIIFGSSMSVNTADQGRGGAAFRFCKAFGAILHARLPDCNPFRDDEIDNALWRLKSENGVADRIRDIRGGGSVRKR